MLSHAILTGNDIGVLFLFALKIQNVLFDLLPQDWREILTLYEADNLYLGELVSPCCHDGNRLLSCCCWDFYSRLNIRTKKLIVCMSRDLSVCNLSSRGGQLADPQREL